MPISIAVFNSGYKPIPNPSGWTAPQQATWPATTATLIAGSTDALLVDALITTTEGERLAAWVQASGKNLSMLYITHGHPDHFFGAGPTLAAFPQAQFVALPEVVAEAHRSAQSLEHWKGWLGGNSTRTLPYPWHSCPTNWRSMVTHCGPSLSVGATASSTPRSRHSCLRRCRLQQHPHVAVPLHTGNPKRVARHARRPRSPPTGENHRGP
ncbi:MBL fold metallo-hydrolase [Streptomyces sp. NPDC005046]